jgi:hypothetical protein
MDAHNLARCLFDLPRLALAARSPRLGGKLALRDLRDHADQHASHGHAAGGRHGRNAPHARAVGCSPCRPFGNPDLSVGSAMRLLNRRRWGFERTRPRPDDNCWDRDDVAGLGSRHDNRPTYPRGWCARASEETTDGCRGILLRASNRAW